MSSSDDEDVAAPVEAGAVVDFIGRRIPRSSVSETNDSDAGTVTDMDGFYYEDYHLEQYAQEVFDYSSQYGSGYSISYTATNITGRPTKYPEYGDFPETFAMRTYGEWWGRAPSATHEIQAQNLPKIPAHDFIVIFFENYIIPDEIAIFETFSPGAIVRIWAHTIAKTWICLWEDTVDFFTRPPYAAKRARKFSPPLKKLQLPTKIIRLEFNHSRLNYFTEIDGVLLRGTYVRNSQNLLDYYERIQKSMLINAPLILNGSIVHKLQSMKFRPHLKENYQSHLQDFIIHDLDKFNTSCEEPPVKVTSALTMRDTPASSSSSQSSSVEEHSSLKDMPYEIMLKIFSYLDLVSLFRVGQVSHYFYDVATHPLLYSELNLKPYWYATTTDLICTLAKRSSLLKKLDLSWCGLHNSISPTEFKKFIQQRGDSVTHLRLNSCNFLNSSCIESIAIVCDNLKELSLRNLTTDPPLLNFSCLANLKNLERLDLFQTVIESDLLLTMIESNRKLKHLNLAYCAVNMDEVAEHIGNYNKQLISLDMWKSPLFSAVGLSALSRCHELQEIDVGWCLREPSLGDSLRQLLNNCPKLKKLFLATVRGITNRDVENIANLCCNLEQLDLMGVLGIAKERYYEILVKCRKLQLLDLSFCDNIDENEITHWARKFRVNIKCSHVPL